jgi:predicted transcriptional regulator
MTVTQSLLEMAKDLTRSLMATDKLSPEAMRETLHQTYTTLTALKAQEEAETATSMSTAGTTAADWRKSITRHSITCLECGLRLKQLSVRHLMMHGLNARAYRVKYAIPQTQPLAARATTTRRRQVVQEVRPWEKAPTYRKAQTRHHATSSEPEAQALPEAAEEPSATAPVQPKQQSKTTPKKTARKTRPDA